MTYADVISPIIARLPDRYVVEIVYPNGVAEEFDIANLLKRAVQRLLLASEDVNPTIDFRITSGIRFVANFKECLGLTDEEMSFMNLWRIPNVFWAQDVIDGNYVG